jgi:hypothetical protein
MRERRRRRETGEKPKVRNSRSLSAMVGWKSWLVSAMLKRAEHVSYCMPDKLAVRLIQAETDCLCLQESKEGEAHDPRA